VLAAGLGLVAYLVYSVGPATILDTVSRLSWRVVIVLCFPYVLTCTLDTAAWRFAFTERVPPFGKLWSVRLAGEAVNATTPAASVGGEPVKVYLLRYWVPPVDGAASVIVDKTALVVGQGLFLIVGLTLAHTVVPVSGPIVTAMTTLLGVEALAVGGFVAVQLLGIAGRGGRLLARFGMRHSRSRQERLEGLDQRLAEFYRQHRRRLAAGVLVHFAAWTAGSLEIYLVLNFLGLPVSLLTAVVLESFGAAVKFASFMIPGSIGALEGGNVAIFAAFGLGGGVGLSYTLVRRLREAVWVAGGMIALAALSGRPSPVEVERDAGPPSRSRPLC
jgi:putative membrane protein